MCYFLQTPQVPCSRAQCLHSVQFLHAVQFLAPVHFAFDGVKETKVNARRKAKIVKKDNVNIDFLIILFNDEDMVKRCFTQLLNCVKTLANRVTSLFTMSLTEAPMPDETLSNAPRHFNCG